MKFFKDKVELNEIIYDMESLNNIHFPIKVEMETDNEDNFKTKPLWMIIEESRKAKEE